ncbi:MAG TPA: hypothetical protein VF862_11130 [Gemmatimonadales bacterium]
MRSLLFSLGVVTLAACSGRGSAEGRLQAEWQGARSGTFSDVATATHCAESGIVFLEAIRADSGVAMALHPADPAVIAPGTFPAMSGSTPNPPKPVVFVGLRSFEATEVRGWEAHGGTVTIDTAGGVLSGRFDLRMQLVDGTDTLTMTGTLTAVRVVRDTAGCLTRLRRNY